MYDLLVSGLLFCLFGGIGARLGVFAVSWYVSRHSLRWQSDPQGGALLAILFLTGVFFGCGVGGLLLRAYSK